MGILLISLLAEEEAGVELRELSWDLRDLNLKSTENTDEHGILIHRCQTDVIRIFSNLINYNGQFAA